MDWEILENGEKVSRNRKKKYGEQNDRDVLQTDPELPLFIQSFCDSFISHSSEAKL